MSYERFTLTRPGPGVALVTIDRADKLNAMDPLFFEELIAVTDELGRDPDVRAAVLTGAGRAFSAGGDIDGFHDMAGDTARLRTHTRLVFDAFSAVERCPVPVIGAINGIAYGGGTEMAELPPLAVEVGKVFANRGTGEGFAEALEATVLLFTTPEHAEQVAAFRAR